MSTFTDVLSVVGTIAGTGATIYANRVSKQADAAKREADEAKTKSLEAIKKAEDAQSRAQVGWLELQLRVHLSSRRDKIHEVTRDLEAIRLGREPGDLGPQDLGRLRDVHPRFVSAHEEFLVALEQACRHYRDDKLDKESFRLMYESEVKDVCEGEPSKMFQQFMHPSDTSKFRAIWAVYKEWFRAKS